MPSPQSLSSRLTSWLHGSRSGLAFLAVLIGLGAGVGAVAFRYLIVAFTVAFTGREDYGATPGASRPDLPWLGPFFVLLTPVIGGLLYGPLVARFAPEARGHGVPEVMVAVAERGGRIRPQVALVKALASALCIGSGGSVGREGPIVQIGSALGSAVGQLLRLPESRLRLLVACGAAGGISATFNAPIAGVFFALELILRDFEAEFFGVVVLASVAANVVARPFFGTKPFLALPAFELVSIQEAFLYLGLGVLAAIVGLTFIRVLYGAEDLADRLWHGPEAIRPVVGGLVLGVLLLAVPQMYGVGYPIIEQGINGQIVVGFLLLLLVAKVIATSLTIAIGGSGGVFAPSLVMGAMLGSAYGTVVHTLLPGITAPAGAYGIVGMGAVFAATSRAPITAVLIIFELTGEYQIILPLMFAVALSQAIASRLSVDSIYTLKLRRRGIDIRRGRGASLMELLTVSDAMGAVPDPLPHDAPLDAILERVTGEHVEALPVTDAEGTFRGVVARSELEGAMRENELAATASELAREVPALSERQTLAAALGQLVNEATGLPVLDGSGALVGWLTHEGVLRAYQRRLTSAARSVGSPGQDGSRFSGLEGYRIVELDVGNGIPAGQQLGSVPWPAHTLVLAVLRSGRSFVPSGSTTIRARDRLTVLVPQEYSSGLADVITSAPAVAAEH